MKKILLLSVIVLFAFSSYVKAQDKIKEGKIKFEMSYPDSMSSQMASYLPTEMIIYFKNGNSRTEMKMEKGDMTMILFKTGDHYMLMDMTGQKMAIKSNKEQSKKLRDSLHMEMPVVTMTDETKTIAFFKCRKAIVTMMMPKGKGEKQTYEAWVTKDIDNIDMGDYSVDGVDGFTMECTLKEKGITMHMLCTSIEKMDVPDDMFKIPDDYKVMTMDEMMKGGMSGKH